MNTGSVRVSSDEQKKKGQQVNAYINSILNKGVDRQNIFVELARSGSMDEDKDIVFKLKEGKLIMEFDLRKKRPDLYKWLEQKVMNGLVSKHYINKWDRLARNVPLGLGIINLCKQHNTKIVAVNDTNDPKMVFFSLTLAQIESMLTKERVDYNKQFKFDRGLYLGTKKLLGYKKDKIMIENRTYLCLVPDPVEKNIVIDIFSDMDYKDVCQRHNITPSQYYAVRRNKFYCGYIEYNGEEKKGIHEPLVSQEIWKMYNS